MNKQTKQAYIFHSLLIPIMGDISKEIVKSISSKFGIPTKKVEEAASPFITSLFVHILHLLIIKKIDNGEAVAKKFLINIGKSDQGIKYIHDLYGKDNIGAKASFIGNLEHYLELTNNANSELLSEEKSEKMDALFHLYYLRIKSACEVIAETDVDKMELKDRGFDYTDSAWEKIIFDKNVKKCKENIKTEKGRWVIKIKCPKCDYSGKATYGLTDFKSLGKDRLGNLYFECSQCKNHIKFNPIEGVYK